MPKPGKFLAHWADDAKQLSAAAKGAWVEIQMILEKSQNPVELTDSLLDYSRLFGCVEEEVLSLMEELSKRDLIRYLKRDCNGLVTLIHLRNEAKFSQTLSLSLRVSKYRERLEKEKKELPDEFDFSEKRRAFAEKYHVCNAEKEFELFKEKARRNGSKYADWDGAWRTWILEGIKNGWVKTSSFGKFLEP